MTGWQWVASIVIIMIAALAWNPHDFWSYLIAVVLTALLVYALLVLVAVLL